MRSKKKKQEKYQFQSYLDVYSTWINIWLFVCWLLVKNYIFRLVIWVNNTYLIFDSRWLYLHLTECGMRLNENKYGKRKSTILIDCYNKDSFFLRLVKRYLFDIFFHKTFLKNLFENLFHILEQAHTLDNNLESYISLKD